LRLRDCGGDVEPAVVGRVNHRGRPQLAEDVAKQVGDGLLEQGGAGVGRPARPVVSAGSARSLLLTVLGELFPFVDPHLPAELLPDWIGRQVAAMLKRQRTEWPDTAHARWRGVVAATSPDP
jgi:hypothetical protein